MAWDHIQDPSSGGVGFAFEGRLKGLAPPYGSNFSAVHRFLPAAGFGTSQAASHASVKYIDPEPPELNPQARVTFRDLRGAFLCVVMAPSEIVG